MYEKGLMFSYTHDKKKTSNKVSDHKVRKKGQYPSVKSNFGDFYWYCAFKILVIRLMKGLNMHSVQALRLKI